MHANQVFSVLLLLSAVSSQYTPDWKSLDSRPLPSWYDEAKIGIFIHWGVFSVPSFQSEWFWSIWHNSKPGSPAYEFMKDNYRPDWTYADFASQFTCEFYDPDHWADLFNEAGAKYVVLTSKHHEGYCNWNTNVSFNWNSMEVGPKIDLVDGLAKSIRNRTSIRFGLYHSLFEWYNPLYLLDKSNGYKTRLFSEAKTIPELHELVNTYKPEVIWSDGEWEGSAEYWGSLDFLAWLYNESPVKDSIVVNDRWGTGCACHHGGYYTCTDKYNPGKLQPRKWENAMTIDLGSWGYRRNSNLNAYITSKQLIATLAETISCGGNLLVNIGPTHDGRILPIFEERLKQMGAWLKVNGEAVYSSVPWRFQNDTLTPGIWYTMKKSNTSTTGASVYAMVLDWPKNNQLILQAPGVSLTTVVHMLGYSPQLPYKQTSNNTVTISFPFIPPPLMPSGDAWVLKFDDLKNGFWNW